MNITRRRGKCRHSRILGRTIVPSTNCATFVGTMSNRLLVFLFYWTVDSLIKLVYLMLSQQQQQEGTIFVLSLQNFFFCCRRRGILDVAETSFFVSTYCFWGPPISMVDMDTIIRTVLTRWVQRKQTAVKMTHYWPCNLRISRIYMLFWRLSEPFFFEWWDIYFWRGTRVHVIRGTPIYGYM